MTRENALKLWSVIKAYGEGKEVEFLTNGEWKVRDSFKFCEDQSFYRIKTKTNRTIEDGLQIGDILTRINGISTHECKVFGTIGDVLFLSDNNDIDILSTRHFLLKDIISGGWKLKEEQPEEEIEELTLQEVADLAKVDVNKLRIKE